MNEQPESLRLADELEKDRWHISGVTAQQSADELRRLHEEVERLRSELAAAQFQVHAFYSGTPELRLLAMTKERDALRAEVEQLREGANFAANAADGFRAEADALREAIKRARRVAISEGGNRYDVEIILSAAIEARGES